MPPSLRTSLHRPDEPGIEDAWRRLLAQSPQANAFSHLAFGRAVAEALDFPARVGAAWNGDGLAAGVLLFEKRRGPFCAAALPPSVPYVTPLLAAPLRESDVHHERSALGALADLVRSSYDQAALVLHPSLTDTRALQWAGWRIEPAYTYRIDLRARDTVTSGWSSTTRRTFENEAEHFTVAEGPDHIAEVLALVEASHARQEHGLGVPGSALDEFLRSLDAAGLLRVFVARRGSEVEAGLIVPSDGRTAHYWFAGSVPGAAMTVLVGEVLARLQADGLAYFDLVGANIPSIAEFKRKFGSTLVPYARARYVAHPALRLLDRLRHR